MPQFLSDLGNPDFDFKVTPQVVKAVYYVLVPLLRGNRFRQEIMRNFVVSIDGFYASRCGVAKRSAFICAASSFGWVFANSDHNVQFVGSYWNLS